MKKRGILSVLLLSLLLSGCVEKTAEPLPPPIPTIEGQSIDADCRALTLQGSAGLEELRNVLTLCPQIGRVSLDTLPYTLKEMAALQESFPEVDLVYPLSYGGMDFRSDERALDFSGQKLNAALLTELLPLSKAERVELGRNVPTLEEAEALHERCPEILFRYDTELYGRSLSTEVTEIDLSGTTILDLTALERELVRFPKLKRLELTDCGLEDEALDALNRRHETIQVVWTVQVYNYAVPTDQDYFIQYNAVMRYPYSNGSCINLRYCPELIAADLGHLFVHQEDIEFLRSTPHMRYLVAIDGLYTDISAFGTLQELEYLEMFSSQVTDLSPLLQCKKLEHLNISRCTRLDERCIDVLCQMKQLKRLWFIGNYLSPKYEQVLKDALPDTEIHFIPYRNGFAPYSMDFDWRKDESYYAIRDALHMYYMDNQK